jgi:glycosyltransferase involved in cell wall biosynthesis
VKVLLAVHGYPPELVGGHGLVRAGHEVVVVSGTLRHEQGFRRSLEHDEVDGRTIRVHKIHRADLYFDHWQKSGSTRAALAFRDILREERPDLVHVHHWIRLSRDLVQRAVLERIPAVVTLHDLWTTCLVTFRVKPESGEFCHAPLAPAPCLRCAAQVPPRTPWLSYEEQGIALMERSVDLKAELALARVVLAPTEAHAAAVTRYLGVARERLDLRVVPHGRELALRARSPLAPPAELGKLVLGVWGHLYRLKGADRVLRAVRRLPDPRPVRVHFAGGEPEPAFAAEVHELAQGLDVHFHGPYAASALDTHPVSDAHVFVSGTLAHESFGLVLDEAVALRLPLVLPRSGAYAERLSEGAGALFYTPGDEAALAAVLARLLDEPGLVAALRARLPAAESFTPSTAEHVAELLAIYAEARGARTPEGVRVAPERERMAQMREDAWGAELQRRSGEELGFA